MGTVIKKESGNALFLILIAVALFAALSYAITSSGRGGGNITKEQGAIYATQLNEFLSTLRYGTERMRLRGIPYEEIEFHYGGACGTNYTLCDTGETCLFSSEGGGVTFPNLPDNAFVKASTGMGYPGNTASEFTTNFWLDCDGDIYDWVGNGTTESDRGFFLLDLTRETCLAFNKGLGLEGIPGDDIPLGLHSYDAEHCIHRDLGGGVYEYQIGYLLYSR